MELDEYMALNKVTFYVTASTLMVVAGPNGAGKSMLFNAIAGLPPVHQRRVTLSGVGGEGGSWPSPPARKCRLDTISKRYLNSIKPKEDST